MTSWSELESFALTLAGVTTAQSYGEPSLKLGKALLTRWRKADNSVVLKSVDPDERDMLIATRPQIFFTEAHYRGHDIVLARLDQAEIADIAPFVERTWLHLAGKRARG
jgi:hypothetical protein